MPIKTEIFLVLICTVYIQMICNYSPPVGLEKSERIIDVTQLPLHDIQMVYRGNPFEDKKFSLCPFSV
ncbi:MAG: hypothetical protein KAI83_13125 [Thiomargarita sp.]|nr:hypothetical protein [Thiomargarita sp.]